MEAARYKVKDVEVRCKAIHAAAVRAGVRLNSVAITEERTVNVCSHAEHQPFVGSRWRAHMDPCGGCPHDIAVTIREARRLSTTLDGVTTQAVDLLGDLPSMHLEEKRCCSCAEQIATASSDAAPLDSVVLDAPDKDEEPLL